MSTYYSDGVFSRLKDKTYRHALVRESVEGGLPFQIRALREKHGWTQRVLGRKANMKQSAISRLEDPDYGKISLKSLFALARAFDVALTVRFVSFGDLMASTEDLSPAALAVPSYDEERKAQEYLENRAARVSSELPGSETVIASISTPATSGAVWYTPTKASPAQKWVAGVQVPGALVNSLVTT
jgi:transcriptional regulator with XRE-family HTH domain